MPASISPVVEIVDHGLRRRIDARVDHQRIWLCIRHQAVDRHVGGGRRAGNDADMLALEPRVFQRVDLVESAARLGDQRIGRAVIGIGALDQFVALRKAHDDIAAMRAERHPHEAGRLREIHVVELLLQLRPRTTRRACSRTLRPSRWRTADFADRRRPAAPWDRPVRSRDRRRSLTWARAVTRGRPEESCDRDQGRQGPTIATPGLVIYHSPSWAIRPR